MLFYFLLYKQFADLCSDRANIDQENEMQAQRRRPASTGTNVRNNRNIKADLRNSKRHSSAGSLRSRRADRRVSPGSFHDAHLDPRIVSSFEMPKELFRGNSSDEPFIVDITIRSPHSEEFRRSSWSSRRERSFPDDDAGLVREISLPDDDAGLVREISLPDDDAGLIPTNSDDLVKVEL